MGGEDCEEGVCEDCKWIDFRCEIESVSISNQIIIKFNYDFINSTSIDQL